MRYLDEGQAGLVVVGVSEMEDDIKGSMGKAEKVETREIQADNAEIEQDAKRRRALVRPPQLPEPHRPLTTQTPRTITRSARRL